MKKQDIWKEDWDYLMVLDACRFDFFKDTYEDYLDGDLKRRISKGSSTGEWLVKTFPDFYDITYISGNGNINSKGVSCFRQDEWTASDHFEKIIDVWEWGWDKELMTVKPAELNKALLENIDDGNKKIIHYMQPHAPYITYPHSYIPTGTIDPDHEGSKDSRIKDLMKEELIKFSFRFEENFGKVNSWRLRRLLRITPRNPLEEVWRECSLEQINRYYEQNLRLVLEGIAEVIEELKGRIVVTADHGEAFGEEGIWEHPSHSNLSILKEVPWLEVRS